MVLVEKKPIPWGLPPLRPAAPAASASADCASEKRQLAEPLLPASYPAAAVHCGYDGRWNHGAPGLCSAAARQRLRWRMTVLVAGLALAASALLYVSLAMRCPMRHGAHGHHAPAPAGVPQDTLRVVERLLAAAHDTANTVAWDRLAEMTDLFGHRMTASKAYSHSARWVVDTANRLDGGLVAYTEPVLVRQWERNHESLRLFIPTRQGGGVSLKMLGLGNSVHTPLGGITADIVPVHSFEELVALGNATVAGKIVLFNFPFTGYGATARFRSRGALEAEKYGAQAVLVRTLAPDTSFDSVHTGSSTPAGIPAASISLADANLIERMYRRSQASPDHAAPRAKLVMHAWLRKRLVKSSNVIIDLKGSERPEEIVLLSGHFDSWDVGVGAMDDGAGAFLAWEALRLVAAAGRTPRRTIRVVMWNNEETLQLGAKAYVARHRDEIANHTFAIESDIGVFDPWGLAVAAKEDVVGTLRGYGRDILHVLGAGNITSTPNEAPGADIAALCNHGVPCAGFLSLNPENGTQPGEPGWEDHYFRYHHAESDRMEVIDKHQLRRSAAALAAWSYLIADS